MRKIKWFFFLLSVFTPVTAFAEEPYDVEAGLLYSFDSSLKRLNEMSFIKLKSDATLFENFDRITILVSPAFETFYVLTLTANYPENIKASYKLGLSISNPYDPDCSEDQGVQHCVQEIHKYSVDISSEEYESVSSLLKSGQYERRPFLDTSENICFDGVGYFVHVGSENLSHSIYRHECDSAYLRDFALIEPVFDLAEENIPVMSELKDLLVLERAALRHDSDG